MVRLSRGGGQVSPAAGQAADDPSLRLSTARRPVDAWRWPLLVALVVLLANLPSLLGWVATNPFELVGGLAQGRHAPVLTGLSSIDPNNGFTVQALGTRAALDWLHGHVPWWNPYEGLGAPLAAEMQSGAFFPPILLVLLPRGVLLLHVSLELTTGLATYALGRQLGLRGGWAAAIGVAFGLNGTFAWLGNAAVNPVAFLPLTLLGVERYLAGRRGGWTLTAGAVAFGLYSGFPETAALDLLFAGAWSLARLVTLRPLAVSLRRALALAGAAGTGALLAAPLLAPFVGYLGVADVADHRGGFSHAFVPGGAASVGFPYLFGPIFGWLGNHAPRLLLAFWSGVGGYVTFGVLLLACVGVCAGRGRRALRATLAAWALLFLARSYGVAPAMDLFRRTPGFSLIAVSRYSSPSCEFALVLLAGFGLEAVAGGRRFRLLAGVALAGVVAAVLWVDAATLRDMLQGLPGYSLFPNISLVVAALLLCLLLGLIWAPPPAGSTVLAVVIAVEAAAAFAVPQLSAPRRERIDLAPVRFLQTHLGEQRFFTLGDPNEPLAPNYGSALGLAELDVNDLPIPRAFAGFVHTRLAPAAQPTLFIGVPTSTLAAPSPLAQLRAHETAYAASGVAYVLVPSGMAAPGLGSPVSRSTSTSIYALPGPRALFSVLRGGPCLLQATSPTTARGTCAAPAAVGWNELRLPGWSAVVNDREVALAPSGAVFQQLDVPGGSVRLSLNYLPPQAPLGIALGVLGLLVCAVVAGVATTPRASSPT